MPEKPHLILGPLVGGLSHESANLWARAIGPATLHAWIGLQPDLSDAQLAGKSLPLRAEDGYAGVVPLRELKPETRYHYALTLKGTRPKPSEQPFPHFATFPKPGAHRSFAFAFGSCFCPKDENGGQIFRRMDEQRQADDLRFLLMIGDQVYTDLWKYNSLGKVAATLSEYRAVYAYTFSRPPLRDLLTRLPVFMTLDDHEVDDDWRWLDFKRRWATIPWWDKVQRWLDGRPPEERYLSRGRVREALPKAYSAGLLGTPGNARPALSDPPAG